MSHPTQRMVESLHDKGACPRIQVDLTHEGVVCPDFVREQWGEQLVIDLDPTYPLDLTFTDDAVEADLSFDGFVTRCVFPFRAIYMVADRETGKGMVIEQNMPASVRRKRQAGPKPLGEAALRAEGKRARSGKSRRRRRPGAEPEPEPAPAPSGLRLAAAPEPEPEPDAPAPVADAPQPVADAPQPVADAAVPLAQAPTPTTAEPESAEPAETPAETPAAASKASDAEAQRRRSVFQVIDGER